MQAELRKMFCQEHRMSELVESSIVISSSRAAPLDHGRRGRHSGFHNLLESHQILIEPIVKSLAE